MQPTPVSLLARLREPGQHADAWGRFVELYTPLLYAWARRAGLEEHDAADLVQDVLLILVRRLPEFRYDPGLSFRAWLKTILLNKWREKARTRVFAIDRDANGEDVPVPDPLIALEEDEYARHLVGRALRILQADYQPTTWRAFWDHSVEGRPVAEVAVRHGVSVKAVYLARARILRRLREELAGLV